MGGYGVEEKERKKSLKKNRDVEKGEEDEGSLVIKRDRGFDLHN